MKLVKFISLIVAVTSLAVGCNPEPEGQGNEQPKGGVPVLTADCYSLVVNTPINFTVTLEGADVTAESTIFDGKEFVPVTNPFTPTIDGDYEFYAVVGEQGLISENIKVAVTPIPPALPEDGDKANTSFKHRMLLVDHTGNTCQFCPQMMLALKEIAEDTEYDYHSKYYEAMAHSYTATDPAGSSAANAISSYYGVQSYPSLSFNFVYGTFTDRNAELFKTHIKSIWKESADAGIAASANFAATSVIVNAEVKAAVENEYRINAWLLEDGIYAKQAGSGNNDWMNTHNNAIRQTATTEPISGFELGTIAVGETASMVLKLDKSDAWERKNMKVMLIASAKDSKGNFEVVNVAICPIEGSVTYDYNDNL